MAESRLNAERRLSKQFHDGDIETDDDAKKANLGFDVIIVGTGYGGAVAASRLARASDENGKPLDVAVLERGKEFKLGEYPTSISDLPNRVWIDSPEGTAGIEADALFDVRINEGVSILSGRGLGGTSQINANVAARPDARVFQHKAWPAAIRDHPEKLSPYFLLAEEMLQPHPYPTNRTEPNKLTALRQFYQHLKNNGCKDAEFVRPPLTVNFEENYQHPITGVPQNSCTDCGNCIAGCNEGAKSTLTVNYLHDAKATRDDKLPIFALCTVTHILRNPDFEPNSNKKPSGSNRRWKIYVRDTAHPTRVGFFRSDLVILAGGVIGTTEILLRSRRHANEINKFFLTSDLLGARISANADMIGFGYGHRLEERNEKGLESKQRKEGGLNTVNWGNENEKEKEKRGPTITGMIDLRKNKPLEHGIVIQEGATPSAFAWIFEEVIGLTSSLRNTLDKTFVAVMLEETDKLINTMRRVLKMKGKRRSEYFKTKDMLLPSKSALGSTQVYLAMGHDKISEADFEDGRIELIDNRPRVQWTAPGRHATYAMQHDILRHCTTPLGGLYIPNPGWEFLSKQAAKKIGDKKEAIAPNTVVTVHPLGGCCMGDNAAKGVVDDCGAVFSNTTGTEVHPGLYVWDGSTLPTSLGINPLLTITALAERSVARLAATKRWKIDYTTKTPSNKFVRRRIERAQGATSDGIAIEFHEVLEGKGYWPHGRSKRYRPLFQKWADKQMHAFKVKAELTVKNVQPNSKNVDQVFRASCVSGDVEFNEVSPEVLKALGCLADSDTVKLKVQPFRVLETDTPAENQPSTVELFSSERPGAHWFPYFWKRFFVQIRSSLYFRKQALQSVNGDPRRQSEIKKVLRSRWPWEFFRRAGYWWLTRLKRRAMHYRLWLGETKTSKSLLMLDGYKDLAHYFGADLMDGLTTMQVHFLDPDNSKKKRASALLKVPLDNFLRNDSHGLWEWGQGYLKCYGNDRIKSLAALASAGAYFARAIAFEYPPSVRKPIYPAANPLHRPAGRMRKDHGCDEEWLVPKTDWIEVEKHGGARDKTQEASNKVGKHHNSEDKITLLLTSFRQTKSKGPILLLHGFGASSLTFALDIKGQQNLAQRLWHEGFDVWLLDYRSSIVLPTAADPCTLDEVAEFDIPAALEFIWEHYEQKQDIHVLAHCIGAAALMIALLSGHAKHVRSVISSQVGLTMIGAPMNRFKRPVAFFLNRVLQADMVTAYADEKTGVLGRAIDLLLSVYPLPVDERCTSATCHRLTAIYGRIFNHRHVMETGKDCTHDHLHELFGYANTEMFRQVSRCFESMSLCTSDGESAWVRRWRIQKFMTMPILFLHGKDNDVFEPDSTYQTWDILRQVNFMLRAQFKRVEFEGYGHQDCIVGKEASKRVFPEMLAFLDDVNKKKVWTGPWHVGVSQGGKRREKLLPDRSTEFKLPIEAANILEKLKAYRRFDIQLPFLGPIIGHTTCSSVRVWIRANEVKPIETTCNEVKLIQTMCQGVACLINIQNGQTSTPLLKDLIETKNRDCYCVFTFNDLLPGQNYRIEVGTITYESNQRPRSDEIKTALHREICDAVATAEQQGVNRRFSAVVRTMPNERRFKSLALSPRFAAWQALPFNRRVAPPVQLNAKKPASRKIPVHAGRIATAPVAALRRSQNKRAWLRGGGLPARHSRPKAIRDGFGQRLPATYYSPISFILGSCHHPIDDFGGRENNVLFEGLEQNLDNDKDFKNVRFMLMVGDQIYADPYERMGFRALTAREFSSVYTQAFAPNSAKARVMTRLPTYMILDDHEIVDAWDSSRTGRDDKLLFDTAIDAYRCYQASHGPDRNSYDGQLWYEFESGGIPFFVLDTRTEREIKDGHDSAKISKNKLISDRQHDALEYWLNENQRRDVPIFIVSSSVLAPHTQAPLERQDSWARFPSTRERVLDLISNQKIRNVIFLTGDYHCSTIARIDQKDTGELIAHSIVASPFHCTVNFVNVQSYDLYDSLHMPPERKYFYEILNDPNDSSGKKRFIIDSQNGRNDNFAKIDVCKKSDGNWSVTVTYYVYTGEPPLTTRGPITVI